MHRFQSPGTVTIGGTARLPASLAVSDARQLEISLTVDARTGHIVGLTTSVSAGRYDELLWLLLVGRGIDEIGPVIEELPTRLGGRLLKPTIEALTAAAAKGTAILHLVEGEQDQPHDAGHRPSANAYGLTARQLEVLRFIGAGYQDKAIAAALGISTLTVRKHVSNILEKLDVSSRTGAATKAVRKGLIA